MKPSDAITWMWTHFRYGPQRATFASRFAGSILWWRIWLAVYTLIAPYLVGLLVYEYAGAFMAIVAVWVASVILVPKAMSVSPKWEISENY